MALQKQLEHKRRELLPRFQTGVLPQHEEVIFQFVFEDGAAPFHLNVEPGEFTICAGKADIPTLTLYVDSHETCWGLLLGEIDGMQAFMDGRYRADGNILLSQLLLYLFRVEDPTITYRVRD